jgi:hypothetical protein
MARRPKRLVQNGDAGRASAVEPADFSDLVQSADEAEAGTVVDVRPRLERQFDLALDRIYAADIWFHSTLFNLASLIEKRLPPTVIQSLVRGGLSDAEVYHLIVPRRTLAHAWPTTSRSRRTNPTGPCWLRKPKRHYNGKTPIEMLVTEAGARLVEEMVAQIEDGMAA